MAKVASVKAAAVACGAGSGVPVPWRRCCDCFDTLVLGAMAQINNDTGDRCTLCFVCLF